MCQQAFREEDILQEEGVRMVDPEIVKRKMMIFGGAGLVIGIAIFGVAWMSYHNLFH